MRLILVVDDIPELREGYARVLLDAGYEVCRAVNGEDCLAKAKEFRPDLILLNITMPVMDGVAACRKLRESPEGKTVPVILTSSHPRAPENDAVTLSGADDYLEVPCPKGSLLAAVRKRLP